jgi:hypothetical protein
MELVGCKLVATHGPLHMCSWWHRRMFARWHGICEQQPCSSCAPAWHCVKRAFGWTEVCGHCDRGYLISVGAEHHCVWCEIFHCFFSGAIALAQDFVNHVLGEVVGVLCSELCKDRV